MRRCVSLRQHQWRSCLARLSVICAALIFNVPSRAVFIPFQNCLSPNVIHSSEPRELQFVPLFAWAAFNATAPSHNLNVTIYGNVAGLARQVPYPPPDAPSWTDPTNVTGKIPDEAGPDGDRKYTTFLTSLHVLGYTLYNPPASRLCNTSALQECPWSPVMNFSGTSADAAQLPAMTVAHDLYSSYALTTINTFVSLKSGDVGAAQLACIETSITPQFSNVLVNTLGYIPLVILICVAVATACAAIFSPWGTIDVFRFTTNYGRDDDLLRLVTPGFGDCLQYIQFIVLAGSLSLNYPGFYQPVVSQVSWSALMFNQSFVSRQNGYQAVVDGIYNVNGTYGMHRMAQLIGLSTDEDIWTGMIIWLLAITAALVILIQFSFAAGWAYRTISNIHQEDLRQKNLPFTAGNALRIVFNYFLLPIVALSCYQLVVADHSPRFVVGLAAIVLVLLISFAAFLLWLITTTRPRSYLFDDLPTVLLYGPLYNTYSDSAAAFALVPILVTIMRGIAIGAVQASGPAQLVLLAICEVITILTLNAFRPFHSPTSMNAYHTFFAAVRLISVLMSVAFLPSLNVNDSPKGWIGYILLLLHAIVLVFGFFLNACQTLIEVLARLSGAGGEDGSGGATRGGLVKIFGMRQLSRRNPRKKGRARQSIASDVAMLTPMDDRKSVRWSGGRSRSMSGNSAILLNRSGGCEGRQSMALDSASACPGDTPISGGASAFSFLPGSSSAHGDIGSAGGIINLRSAEPLDPYYRPPRARRTTLEQLSSQSSDPVSSNQVEAANKRWIQHSPQHENLNMYGDLAMEPRRGTPLSSNLGLGRGRSNSDIDEARHSRPDYATREVDFYYGTRGPALSSQPTRRLKTGPADPTGPVSSASTWLKDLFGGKSKDQGKGFEVVRSSRAPTALRRAPSGDEPTSSIKPYKDDQAQTEKTAKEEAEAETKGIPTNGPDGPDLMGGSARLLDADNTEADHSNIEDSPSELDERPESQILDDPPVLPLIESSGRIDFPGRIKSTKSAVSTTNGHTAERAAHPSSNVSRGNSSVSTINPTPPLRLTTTFGSEASARNPSVRLPFAAHESTLSRSTAYTAMTGDSHLPSNELPLRVSNAEDSGVGREETSRLLGADMAHPRPTSIGFVQQHRASDHIHAGPSHASEVTVEVFDDTGATDPEVDATNAIGQAH